MMGVRRVALLASGTAVSRLAHAAAPPPRPAVPLASSVNSPVGVPTTVLIHGLDSSRETCCSRLIQKA